jgi:hypothetical protein
MTPVSSPKDFQAFLFAFCTDEFKSLGQELAFHFAADPALDEQFAQSLPQRKRKPKTTTAASTAVPGSIAAVRGRLLARSTSKALKEKLGLSQ